MDRHAMGRLTGIDLFFLRKMVLVDRRITPVEKEWNCANVESFWEACGVQPMKSRILGELGEKLRL